MIFYNKIEPLSRQEHKDLRLKPQQDFAFARTAHMVPLAGAEFYSAARYHPVVFSGEKENLGPIAILGLKKDENDNIDADGRWRKGAYIPAFIRRYPFVLAETGKGPEELTVCLDRDYAGWSTSEGVPLFNDDGSNSELLDNALKFLQEFGRQIERTKVFVAELDKRGLLIRRNADITGSDGSKFHIQDFLAVDEEKFGKLPAADLEFLHQQGFLGWIYAHLMSIANFTDLFELHRARVGAPPKA
jgi:hypothetical protein